MRPRNRLHRIGQALASPGALLTIGALFIAVFVWFVGPLIALGALQPLGPASVRLTILLLIVLAWGVAGFFIRTQRSKEDQALISALRRQQDEERVAADRNAATSEAEFAAFRAGTRDALRATRKGSGLNLFARDRYKMPWYLVMGSHGSGKSAIALNSGLTLPYRADSADGAAAGFHLADQAVLIEIDGRVLKQSERAATSLWLRMLDHLRTLRPQQPINGIVITISAGELMVMTQEAVIDFASTIRRRLDETTARLRSRPPVYIVVSKLDLVVGFQEFFDTLSTEERSGVLGFPLLELHGPSGQPAAERFKQGFAETVSRLSNHVLLRLQEEPDDYRRRRAFEFPTQFAAMQAALEAFVSHVASARRHDAPPLVRGLFFASAKQANLSIDLLARPLSANFAQQPGTLALRADGGVPHGRPYFLRNLLADVILREAGVGGLSRPAAMLAKVQGVAANVIVTIAAFTLFALWWLGFSEGGAYTTRLEERTRQAQASIHAAASGGQAPSSFEPVLAALDDLRALADERPQRSTFGLYGTSNVEEASQAVYERSIEGMMLPFAWRYLRNGLDDPETPAYLRFQQLKLYLMLSGERPVDAKTAALLGPDFSNRWLPYDSEAQTDAVSGHLAGLAATEVRKRPADAALVDRTRGRIADYTLARLAYDSLGAQPEIRQLPVWRPVDHMGLSGPQALARVTGASFWDGVPGLFTRSGFLDAGLPATGPVSEALAGDLWVMGADEADTAREARRIREGMLDLYRVDYIRQWDSLLSDLTMIEGASAGDVARAQAIIAGAPSPIKELALAIAGETNLADTGLLGAVGGAAASAAQINPVAATALAPQRVVNVGEAVTSHFKPFIQAVSAEEGQQSQVDAMLAALEPLYRQINHVATGGDVLELGVQPQTTLNQLGEQANALPAPLQPLFRRILAQAAAVTGGSSRERLSQIWATTVAPACAATTVDRYPFAPASSSDTSISDFASLFGPKGLITAFRTDYLKPFIDTSAKPWRWRVGQQVGLNLGDDVLAAFERADEITTAYFGDADMPAVNFTIEPTRLDPAARAMQLDIGGPTLVYAHGPSMSVAFQWPPERADAEALLSVTPEIAGERNMLRRQGPWALFRLFDAGRVLQPEPTDVVPYGFSIGSRKVVLNVTAPATRNPFAKDILAGFECPTL